MATENQIMQSGKGEMQPTPFQNRNVSASLFKHVNTLFGLAAALALGVGITLWALEPDYMPLFDHVAEQDAVQIMETLHASNIPYKIEKGSGLITVPSEKIQDARLKLASAGLPKSISGGFEMLQQEQGFGTSQFIEIARYQHILETELSRTVAGMGGIDSVRVHLAMPKQSVFVRNQTKPSASVLIKLMPGRVLERSQVQSIIHLVASSVPYMEASRVTVVDQWGNLLTAQETSDEFTLTNKQFYFSRKLEETYSKRIESLLTPILGMGRARAEVNAEMDFSLKESTQEVFQPSTDKIRSEQVQESKSTNALDAIGIPGALSNQPPGAGTTVVSSNTADEKTGSASTPSNSSRNTTRNYEMDKTTMHTRDTLGEIKRITVAVVVDDRETVNDKGKATKKPLSQQEIDLITSLVKEVIGFKETRGDSVAVINSTFKDEIAIEPVAKIPLWEQPWIWTLLKQILAACVVLFMIFGIVRPALKNLTGKPSSADKYHASGALKKEFEGEEKFTLSLQHKSAAEALPAPPKVYGDILNMARAMAVDDPKRVAKVVKDWLASDA